MVMVRVSGVLLIVGMLMLAGCKVGNGPFMANALDVPLKVTIGYPDGNIRNFLSNPSDVEAIGPDRFEHDDNRWLDAPIIVVIKEAGRVLHQFNAEEVRLLIEKQERDWGLWCIDREKVYLANYSHLWDIREYCSKGKRLWTWQNGRFSKEGSENP